MFFVPVVLVTIGTLSVVSGPTRTYVLAVVLLILAALAALVAMRWITFERYLE